MQCRPPFGFKTWADVFGPNLRGERPVPTMEVAEVESHSSTTGDCSVPLRLKEFRTDASGYDLVTDAFQIIPLGCWDTLYLVVHPLVLAADAPLYIALAKEQGVTGLFSPAAGDMTAKYPAIAGGNISLGFLTLRLDLSPTDASVLIWSNDGVTPIAGGTVALDVTLDMRSTV